MERKKRVLVTSGRMPAAVEICRALQAAGAFVYTIDTHDLHLTQSSNAVEQAFVVPSASRDFPAFKEAVLSIIRTHGIEMVIPVNEEVLYLSLFSSEFPRYCELFFPDNALLKKLHHKQTFIAYAAELGLRVPHSISYTDRERLPDFTKNDYMLKRAYSRAGMGVIFAKANEHPEHYAVPQDGTWLIQEKLKGQTHCSCTVVERGKILSHVVYMPSVINGTSSIVFKRVEISAIRDWVETFVQKSGYHGTISMDFIVSETGDVAAIECNPRPTSGVHMIDPLELGTALLHRQSIVPKAQPAQRAQVVLAMLPALPEVLKKGKLIYTFKELLRARDVIFHWHDPLPLFYQIPCWIYLLWLCFLRKQPPLVCLMDGVEWDEDSRAPETQQKVITA